MIGGCESSCGWTLIVKGFLEKLKDFSLGDQIGKRGQWRLSHLGGGKAGEIQTKATEEPVDFINAIDWSSNGMKLITKGLERPSIFNYRSHLTSHQLKVILEPNFSGF